MKVFFKLTLGVLLGFFALHVYAACTYFDGFIDNRDGTVTDPRDGLIWKRCSEGKTWDGTSCRGQAPRMTWFDAMITAKNSRFLGKSDWRLPTIHEIMSIVGKEDQCGYDRNYSVSRMILSEPYEPDGHYMFSSTVIMHDNHPRPWTISPVSGGKLLGMVGKQKELVRLVRSSQSKAGDANSEFNREYANIGQYKKIFAGWNAEENKRIEDGKRQMKAAKATRLSACDVFYPGKVFKFKPAGLSYLGTSINAIVLGVDKSGGLVSFTADGRTVEGECKEVRAQMP